LRFNGHGLQCVNAIDRFNEERLVFGAALKALVDTRAQ